MPRRKNLKISFTCDVPDGADDDDVANFITDALESMGGCRHPDDPLFTSLSIRAVTMRGITYKNPVPKDINY